MRESKQGDASTDRLINPGEFNGESDRPRPLSSNEHQKNPAWKAHTGNLTPCTDYIKTTLKNNTIAKSKARKCQHFGGIHLCCVSPARPVLSRSPKMLEPMPLLHGTFNSSSAQSDLEKNKNEGGKNKISSSQTDLAGATAGWPGHWFCNACAQ